MNMDQDRHMLMVDDNVGNQFRQNAVQNVGNLAGRNAHGNGNVVAARAEGNGNGINGNLIRCYNCQGEVMCCRYEHVAMDLCETAGNRRLNVRVFVTPVQLVSLPVTASHVNSDAVSIVCENKIFVFDETFPALDSIGLFPEAQGKVRFLIVAIDYFTKWIEAKLVATITGNQVKKFEWDNIVCRFGLPGEIISDNGKQFRDNLFKDWCEKLNIKKRFASVKHLQTNDQVERANRNLGEGIKTRPGEDNMNWVEEVPHVLWSHRIMIKARNEDTLFSLTYGTEAVIPVELWMPLLRCAKPSVQETSSTAAMKQATPKNEKLGPKREGPYKVVEALGR
ncbi:reverse transcriptase domain-containing protein [Tanacetum coccineum]